MIGTALTDDELYAQWKKSCDEYTAVRQTTPYGSAALHKAGLMFRKKHVPARVREDLLALIPVTDWTVKMEWLAMHNACQGFLDKDKALLKAARAAEVTHRMALNFAVLLDATGRKENEKNLYKGLRCWEKNVPLTVKEVNNTVGEVIAAWAGRERAEQWVSLVDYDKQWNNGALKLEARTHDNITSILNFALRGTPLRAQLPSVQLPDMSTTDFSV